MTAASWIEIAACFGLLTLLAVPLGEYMARVYSGTSTAADRLLGPAERLVYRALGVRRDDDMTWRRYALAVLAFSLGGVLLLYALLRAQGALPGNPNGLAPVNPWIAFDTAVSFVTNTDWQSYSGEGTMSHLSQAVGLTVQNFLSAAAGMAVLAALIRGFARRQVEGVGNFWVDLTRSVLHVLLPLSIVLAVVLASQGVVQTLAGSVTAHTLEPRRAAQASAAEQVIDVGPVASQVAIKQLGTNGGGYYNASSAHPFENPTPLTNLLEWLAILLLPGAACFTFGAMVGDRRQGWALYAAMLVVLVPLTVGTALAEQRGNPALAALGVDQAPSALQGGGNMEGKEVRIGAVESALWATATTAASNGSVNAMHDSFTPLGGLAPMWLIQLGEVVFGGVGSGLYTLLLHALVAVFIAGLMVGRTPEYLGKKIGAYEMKMASLGILLPSAAVLVGTAAACLLPAGRAALGNPGAHGFSEILYAFSSAGNNNGSAFAGLDASGPFYAVGLGLAMFVGRFGVIVPVLAAAGALARKKAVPVSAGTLPTDGPLFVALLVGTVVLVGALTFVPALSLGPVVEHLQLLAR